MSVDTPIALQGALWMTVGGENLGGAGRIELLSAIGRCGSITQAAKAVKLSYKAAWDAIDAMNNLAGVALVERLAGGKGGGGTRLTARGEQLVQNFRIIEQAHQQFVRQLERQAGGLADDLQLIGRMGLKTTARNQFSGRIVAVKGGAVNDEIVLEVTGGQRIVAIVSCESSAALGLVAGAAAFALIDASAIVILAGGADGARFSARNQLAGRVARLQTGAVNAEVVLELSGGGSLAAMISNDSCASLGLAAGQPATALFKASSVILGVLA